MKTIVTILCWALSFSALAATTAPAPNYTMASDTSQPTDILGELNDDPEQTSLPTVTEATTINTNQALQRDKVKQEWKGRRDTAVKRWNKDTTLRIGVNSATRLLY